MDLLYECAAAYQRLLDIRYKIILGRKGRLTELQIYFEPIHFHHLLGLHKLKDLRIARASREKVFQDILNQKITYGFLSKSQYFPDIEQRFVPFFNLENLLDFNQLIFRYNARSNQFSLIEADYLLSTPYDKTDIYIFIVSANQDGLYFCRSFFPKESKDYTTGQPKYTMLYKEKQYLSTGQISIQYNRLPSN